MYFPWSGIASNWSAVDSGVNNVVDILVMVLYLLLVLGIGMWAILSSSRGTVEDFFLAGRNLAWWLTGASLFASNTGTAHFMGLAGRAAMSGVVIGAFEWNAPFLLCVLGWIFSPIYIKAGVVTMPEYLRKRFGGCRIQTLIATLHLLLYVFHKISVEICTGAMFMRLVLGLDIYLVTIVLLTITGIYTITGGFAAVVYTDAVHAGVMILGSVLLMGFAFKEVGGYQELLHKYLNVKPSITQEGNWTAKPECYLPRPDSFHIFRDPITGDVPWPGVVFGLPILSLYYWCTDQIFVQRCLAGKNMSHVKGSCILCGYLQLLPMFTVVMPGMISRILYTDKVACVTPSECEKHCGARTTCSPIAYPMLIVRLLPKGARGLMLSTLWASLMSSLTSIFNSASALFTLDLYTQIRPMATEKELMVTGRFFVIILLVLTTIWVHIVHTAHSEQLFNYTQAVMSYLVPPIAAVFLLAIFCRRVTEQISPFYMSPSVKWFLLIIHLAFSLSSFSKIFAYILEPLSPPTSIPYSFKMKSSLFESVTVLGLLLRQGAFWGLIGGLLTGFIRMVSEFVQGPQTCAANSKCPPIICGVHYLYFAILLFLVSLLSMLAVSLFTDPIPDKHLHRLCWSLRNSQEERVDLDIEVQKKRYALRTQPALFKEPQSCAWNALDVFCGLEPKPGPRLAPEEATTEKVKTHGALSKEPKLSDTWEETKRHDTLESPFWRRVTNISGLLLVLVTVLCHVLYH